MNPRLPQDFGPYTLTELIARGGMAEIYRATIPGAGGFEKTVAIKKILPHLAENDEFITMLIDEARIIVSINHANIAQVYDLGKIDEDYYIAMEYIHGIDLSTIVKDLKERGETVPVEHAVFIGASIAAGLHVAHNKHDSNGRPLNIVHRDVSPHNVLISFAGDVKIIDFGVAKARGKEQNTNIGVIKGKLLYMAPEQAMAKPIDGRADLFALGLILYRMLTNHLPFEGDNEFQIYNNILSKEIAPPKAFNPAIPEEVNQIVMMLLQRDPSKRYQDGYSAKVDLDRALQNLKPGYSVSRLSRWVEDNFSHLAQRRQQRRRAGVESGDNDYAPATPPRNPVTTEMASPSWGDAQWDVVDEAEDTVNLSLESEEAQRVLEQAREARREAGMMNGSNNGGYPGSGPMGGPPQYDTGRGHHQAPRHTGSHAAPPPHGAGASGSFRTFESGPQAPMPPSPSVTGGFTPVAPPPDFSQQFEVPKTKAPLAPLIGIFFLLVAIGGMLGYQLFLKPQEQAPAVESPPQEPPPAAEGEAEAAPGDSEEAAAGAAAGDAGAPAAEEPVEKVSIDVESTPKGAKVFVGDEELGVTPFEGEIAKSEDVVVLRVEKDGYEAEEVRIIPFSAIRKDISLAKIGGEDEPVVEKAPEPPKKKAQKKRRQTRRRTNKSKKQDRSSSEPSIPLLLDSTPKKKEEKKAPADDEVLNPFAN